MEQETKNKAFKKILTDSNISQETRHERFKRIAAKRTNEILEKIRILGNCSNKSSYEYTEEEVSKIFSEIEKQLKLTKAKFLAGKRERFKL